MTHRSLQQDAVINDQLTVYSMAVPMHEVAKMVVVEAVDKDLLKEDVVMEAVEVVVDEIHKMTITSHRRYWSA